MSIPFLPQLPGTTPQHCILSVTPYMAKEWLKFNVKNRSFRYQKALKWQELMLRGKWNTHSSHITFSPTHLLDGQHRLSAVSYMDDGFSIPLSIHFNVPPEAQKYMDCGIGRSLCDRSDFKPTITAIAKWMWYISGNRNAEMTPDDLEQVYAKHKPLFEWVDDWTSNRGFCRTQMKTAAMWVYKHDEDKGIKFRESLLNEEAPHGIDHPARALRKKMNEWLRDRNIPAQLDLHQYTMAAAAACLQDRPLTKLYRNKESVSWL